MTRTSVIYHSADSDGIFCREIAKKFLPDAELIGWDFADSQLPIPEGQIYILDLPVDRTFGFQFSPVWLNQPPIAGPLDGARQIWDSIKGRTIWIDHHASSIVSHPTDIPGYRIDGVGACRLAWQWFTADSRLKEQGSTTEWMSKYPPPEMSKYPLPEKEDYVARKVLEPLAVRLAGEYDVWDKRDPRADLFQYGLRSRELTPDVWEIMLGNETDHSITVDVLLEGGKVLQYAKTQEDESIIKELGFTFQWEGLTFLACNAARYNSHLFTAGLKPEHDACFGFKFIGHCAGGKPCEEWSVSLYHAPGKEHHDLSLIAVKHGGGGHRGACGFRSPTLPFLIPK